MATRRILVIDNEAYIREVIQISLATVAGWEVLLASSGAEGLAMAAETIPDAILLDVMMPDMDGPTTYEKLQANPTTRFIPVILLTAKIQPADRRRYAELGLTAAIAKPFNPLELATEVTSILGWDDNLEA